MNMLPVPHQQARFAGVCYLIIILCGAEPEVALRLPLIDFGSAEAVALAIDAEALGLRLSIVAVADVALVVLLFCAVSGGLAFSALIFRLLQSGLIAASLLNLQAALLMENPDLSLSFIALHAYGYNLSLFFLALNCLLTVTLIMQSGFATRILGVGIGLSGPFYLVGSVLRFLAPDLHGLATPAYAIPLIAEAAFYLWLLVLPGQGKGAAIA